MTQPPAAPDLPVTSYALLGLLSFGDSLTGYELKQRADRTLRFYWVSPAMSQIYTELGRLHGLGLVKASGAGRSTSYALTPRGNRSLTRWLEDSPVGFPVLKHPVALRLLLGSLRDPAGTITMLRKHLAALEAEEAALKEVRESLVGADGPDQVFRHPSLVADWGLSYFAHEQVIIRELLTRLEDEQPPEFT